MSFSREAIYSALFNLAKTATQAVTASRSLQPLDSIPVANMPALFQHQVTESRAQDKGQPFIITLKVDLYFYTATSPTQADDPTQSAAAQLNSMLDNLDVALKADPLTNVQTLGGLVSHCWIAGNTTYYEDTLTSKAALVVGIEMLLQDTSVDQFAFDAGNIYMIDKNNPNSTPQLVGSMNEINMKVIFQNNTERGNFQYDIKVMRKAVQIKGIAKFSQINGAILSQMLYGQTLTSGAQRINIGENRFVPASGPYTVTVVPPLSGTFTLDLGVIYEAGANAGVPLTLVTSAPAIGQYSVSAGIYTFNASDALANVIISYRYSVTAGNSMVLTNQYSNYVPEFMVVLEVDGNNKQACWTLNSCYSDQLAFVTKVEDFSIPEFSFTAKADASNVIGTFSYSQ